MGIVKAEDLVFEYIRRDEEGNVEGITRGSLTLHFHHYIS